jgi:hypothetical protein
VHVVEVGVVAVDVVDVKGINVIGNYITEGVILY